MSTATISKSVTKGEDLIVLSRKEYERLLRVQHVLSRPIKTFKPTVGEKKAIGAARKRFRKGVYLTLEELRHELALGR